MPNSQFHTAISVPRFGRYLSACDGDHDRALQLYRANNTLSQQMYGVIGVFEVILRNSIDRYMIAQKGELWLEDAVCFGGYLEINPDCEHSFHVIQEAIHQLGTGFSHDALIAKLSFGFWTYQFGLKEFAASGSRLLEAFPKRPFRISRKVMFKSLYKINQIRNRIAHYEPICFNHNVIDVSKVFKRYQLIKELLQWLGCDPEKVLSGIDGVEKAIQDVKKLQPKPQLMN
jgi:hypothetical protein